MLEIRSLSYWAYTLFFLSIQPKPPIVPLSAKVKFVVIKISEKRKILITTDHSSLESQVELTGIFNFSKQSHFFFSKI